MAATMVLPPGPGSSVLESVVDGLAGRRVLVVLDNCEHVAEVAAEVAAAVGRDAPTVTIVATASTSR